ncbi:MAG TPA: hypothetical protein VN783_03425, partial [Thermoanaerobaculia bacterium]|nr:hypothetical protein [Thermoanaerobaculia bacterium]
MTRRVRIRGFSSAPRPAEAFEARSIARGAGREARSRGCRLARRSAEAADPWSRPRPGGTAIPGSGGDSGAAGPGQPLGEGEIAFLICVEANRLEPQARLLCESIRRFGGRYREAPILAVSPRPQLAVGSETRAHLADLGATYVVEALNETGSPYGAINRIVAGAWAERVCRQPYLVVLD